MAREGAIEAEAVIVEVLPNRMYRVELANGYRLLAYVPGKARSSGVRLAPGGRVRLEVSLYDLSAGRIIVQSQTS